MSNLKSFLIDNGISQFFINWLSLNRWVIFLFIFIAAGSTIVYVKNVMKINALLLEVQTISKMNKELQDHNKMLEMEKNKLESADRIIPIAEKQLGMMPMKQPPIYIEAK